MFRGGKVVSLLLLAGSVACPILGCGSSDDATTRPAGPTAVTGVYPRFDPGEHRYVSRCGRGAAPIRVDAGTGTRVGIDGGRLRTGSVEIPHGAGPGDDFTLSLVSGEGRERYQVRCLPDDFPHWRFQSLRPIEPGLFAVSFRVSPRDRPWIIVFDNEGVPRWWYSPQTRALWAQVLRDGDIAWARSFGDGYGLDPRMAHEVRSPSGKLKRVVKTKGEIIDGHEFRELADGNVLVDTYAPGSHVNLTRFGGPANATAVFGEARELDPSGRVVWRWNSRGKIGLGETGRWWRNVLSNGKDEDGVEVFDPVHLNSIDPRGPNEVVISARHTDAIYGIRRSTHEIVWKLGGTETEDSLKIIGDPASKLFGGQHDARVEANGDISVYDNGKDRPRRPRVVSYHLDLKDRTATYLGQLNDSRIKTSHCCGSARPLAGGGWLVSWGDNPLVTAFDRDGRTAFRLELPVSTFRAVPAPPGATTIAKLNRGLEAMEP